MSRVDSPTLSSRQLTLEQQALVQLQNQVQQLQTQLAAHQAAVTAQMSSATTGPTNAPIPSHSFRPKIKEPSLFAGDPQKIDGWLQELHQQFMWYRLASTQDCISLASAHLRGPALDWWCSLGVAGQAMPSWDVFVTSLRSRFQPVSTAEVARRQLDQLRQGPTQNVNDYVAAFRRLLVAIPNMDEGDRKHCFVRGLRPAIANQVLIQRASNLTQAIEIATFVGSVSSSAGGGLPAVGDTPMELSGIEGLEPETGELDPQVLLKELNALRAAYSNGAGASIGKLKPRGMPIVKGLSPQQVKEHLDKGTCFKCGVSGHLSRQCPKRKPEK
jgi:hypothetical protein